MGRASPEMLNRAARLNAGERPWAFRLLTQSLE